MPSVTLLANVVSVQLAFGDTNRLCTLHQNKFYVQVNKYMSMTTLCLKKDTDVAHYFTSTHIDRFL